RKSILVVVAQLAARRIAWHEHGEAPGAQRAQSRAGARVRDDEVARCERGVHLGRGDERMRVDCEPVDRSAAGLPERLDREALAPFDRAPGAEQRRERVEHPTERKLFGGAEAHDRAANTVLRLALDRREAVEDRARVVPATAGSI